MYSDGPTSVLARFDESIIGMKWGTPGRLTPPVHAGLELLIFTESSKLYPLKIRSEIVYEYCGGKSILVSKDPSKRNNLKRTQSMDRNYHSSNPKLSLDDLKKLPVPYSIGGGGGVIAPPAQPHEDYFFNQLPNDEYDVEKVTEQEVSNDLFTPFFIKRLEGDIHTFRQVSHHRRFSHVVISNYDPVVQSVLIVMNKESGVSKHPMNSHSKVDVALTVSFPASISVSQPPAFTLDSIEAESVVNYK